jgi:hypothetical protein
MSGRRLEAMVLTEAEKSELMALAARPKTAQALAERARIVLTWGLSGDWGDHTASAMTGDGWKPQQRGQSSAKAAAFMVPTRQGDGRLYRSRPDPPNLWTLPSLWVQTTVGAH